MMKEIVIGGLPMALGIGLAAAGCEPVVVALTIVTLYVWLRYS